MNILFWVLLLMPLALSLGLSGYYAVRGMWRWGVGTRLIRPAWVARMRGMQPEWYIRWRMNQHAGQLALVAPAGGVLPLGAPAAAPVRSTPRRVSSDAKKRLASPSQAGRVARAERDGKTCPGCGEQVRLAACVCRHCRFRWQSPPRPPRPARGG